MDFSLRAQRSRLRLAPWDSYGGSEDVRSSIFEPKSPIVRAPRRRTLRTHLGFAVRYGAFMEPSGRKLLATNRTSVRRESREIRPKPLPWVATGCRRNAMVRRGLRFESGRGLCKILGRAHCGQQSRRQEHWLCRDGQGLTRVRGLTPSRSATPAAIRRAALVPGATRRGCTCARSGRAPARAPPRLRDREARS
jgi:hypothetical protein